MCLFIPCSAIIISEKVTAAVSCNISLLLCGLCSIKTSAAVLSKNSPVKQHPHSWKAAVQHEVRTHPRTSLSSVDSMMLHFLVDGIRIYRTAIMSERKWNLSAPLLWRSGDGLKTCILYKWGVSPALAGEVQAAELKFVVSSILSVFCCKKSHLLMCRMAPEICIPNKKLSTLGLGGSLKFSNWPL